MTAKKEKTGNLITTQKKVCVARALLSTLAEASNLPELFELGDLAHAKGQVVDIDPSRRYLIIYD